MVVQKIDEEKATLYFRGKGGSLDNPDYGWSQWIRAQVINENQQYMLYFMSNSAERGKVKFYFQGTLLIRSDDTGSDTYKRVP